MKKVLILALALLFLVVSAVAWAGVRNKDDKAYKLSVKSSAGTSSYTVSARSTIGSVCSNGPCTVTVTETGSSVKCDSGANLVIEKGNISVK